MPHTPRKSSLRELDTPQNLLSWISASEEGPNGQLRGAGWYAAYLRMARDVIPSLILHRDRLEALEFPVAVIAELVLHTGHRVPVCKIMRAKDSFDNVVFVRDSSAWLVSAFTTVHDQPCSGILAGVVTPANRQVRCDARLPEPYMSRHPVPRLRKNGYTLRLRDDVLVKEYFRQLGQLFGISYLGDVPSVGA